MQMRSGGRPGRADLAERLAFADVVAGPDEVGVQMRVARLGSVRMIQVNDVTVGAVPAGETYRPAACSRDRRARAGDDIDAAVVAVAADRHVAPAEVGTDAALYRPDERFRARGFGQLEVSQVVRGPRQLTELLTQQRIRGLFSNCGQTGSEQHDHSGQGPPPAVTRCGPCRG